MNYKDNNNNQFKVPALTFLLTDSLNVAIEVPYKISIEKIKVIIKKYHGFWNTKDKFWIIHRNKYFQIKQELKKLGQQLKFIVLQIPTFAFRAETIQFEEIQVKNKTSKRIGGKTPYSHSLAPPQIYIKYSSIETKIDPSILPFFDKLYPFQKQTLYFGINRHCRLLLADEMGVGKTIQSLGLAFIYKYQWPMLIICPSSLRLNWRSEILRWYDDAIEKHEIQIYTKGGVPINQKAKIVIISYDLATKSIQILRSANFQFAIADQAHYLKNFGAKRSDILVPFLAQRKRVIILTGTPAFARPRQIYNLISIVRPDLYGLGLENFREFGTRYCQPKYNPWSRALQYNGSQHQKQLFYLLKDKIMLRRLKKEVLTDLPDKIRQKIVVECNKDIVKKISTILNRQQGNNKNSKGLEALIMQMFVSEGTFEGRDQRQLIMQAYRLTADAKLQSVKQYILELLQNNMKLLIFAHHHKVMDYIEEALNKHNIKSIRIDGKVSKQQRQDRVEMFQENQSIMAAILSISAAGVGFTLTASSTVVFAQLHWTPGMMIQAQDRAHRIGQKNCVNCHYLIGQNTLDQILYNYLQKKVTTVSSFVDGQKKYLDMQETGKYSKKLHTFEQPQIMAIKQRRSSSLLIRKVVIQKKQDEIDNNSETSDISMTQQQQIKISIQQSSRKRVPNINQNRQQTDSMSLQQKHQKFSSQKILQSCERRSTQDLLSLLKDRPSLLKERQYQSDGQKYTQ